MSKILILYYSNHGSVENMARTIAHGVEAVPGCSACIRTVPRITTVCEQSASDVPASGAPYVEPADLMACDGLAVGSPTCFGNMTAPLKYFFDSTSDLWLSGILTGKPASVFCSSTSMHGGQESTLLSMMVPLLHHGMLIVGIPYQESALLTSKSGGSPYGATHVAGVEQITLLTAEEKELCHASGKRLASLAMQLSASKTT